MKFTIIGAYGCGNIGDDAILEGLIKKIEQQYGSGHEIIVLALNTDYIKTQFSVQAIRQVVARGLNWKILRGFAFTQILTSLRTSDVVVIGGGSLIHDRRFYNMPYYVILAAWARCFGAKIFLKGISIGPLSTRLGKWFMRCLYAICFSITFRDERSRDWLEKAGITGDKRLSCDLAFMVPIEYEQNETRDNIVLNICGCFRSEEYWNKDKSLLDKEISNFAKLADRLITEFNRDIVFLNTVVPFDSDTAFRISHKMVHTHRVQVIDQMMTPNEIKKVIRTASMLIGMRLHAIIFSTLTGTPFVAINYDDKVKSFVQRIEQDEYLLELDDLNHFEKVVDTCRKCWNARTEVTQSLKKSADNLNKLINNEDWMEVR